MRKVVFVIIFCVFQTWATGQSAFPGIPNISWNNYSTSYIDRAFDMIPFIMAAIPYNGIYDMADPGARKSQVDLSSQASSFRLRSNVSDTMELFTYDSSDVYFLAPGIFENTAEQYECRVVCSNGAILKPWSRIDQFLDTGISIGNFRPGAGIIGGFSTTWGQYLTVELRHTGSRIAFTTAIVRWQETKPALGGVFTEKSLTDSFLTRILRDNVLPYSSIPPRLTLRPGDDEIIFFLTAGVFKKGAFEYAVSRDGERCIDWKPNDYENSLVCIRDLKPGHYEVSFRYRAQRQQVTTFSFDKQPAWYQTLLFKVIMLLAAIALIGSLLLLVILKKQTNKIRAVSEEKTTIESELKYLRAQLNPHFIFNSLSSIQGLINKGEIKQANLYLNEFSSLLRETLLNNERELTPLRVELSILDRYIKLEQLRFGFAYTIIIGQGIDTDLVEIPSLLLQPLIENAIKHGIAVLGNRGLLNIVFARAGESLHVTITDNGGGYAASQSGKGMGLRLTTERIEWINKSGKEGPVHFTIEGKAGEGTQVTIQFINWMQV